LFVACAHRIADGRAAHVENVIVGAIRACIIASWIAQFVEVEFEFAVVVDKNALLCTQTTIDFVVEIVNASVRVLCHIERRLRLRTANEVDIQCARNPLSADVTTSAVCKSRSGTVIRARWNKEGPLRIVPCAMPATKV